MFDPQIPIETGMQAALIATPVLFGLLATTAVTLRIVARHLANRALDTSDYTMIAALLVTLSFCSVIAAEPFTGAGCHVQDLVTRFGLSPIATYTKMTIANQILWALSVCLPKLSILTLYSRIFTTRFFIVAARVTGAIALLLAIATILGALLQCRPFAYNWDQTIPGGHCGDQVLSFKITASLNVLVDFTVLLLPMPYLFGLELAMAKKAILVATFAGGLITCIFSALRISAIVNMDYTDLTYLAALPSIYSVLEPTLTITLACIPLLRPLLGGSYSANGTYRGRGNKQNNIVHRPSQQPRTRSNDGFHEIDAGSISSQSRQFQLAKLGARYQMQALSSPEKSDNNSVDSTDRHRETTLDQ